MLGRLAREQMRWMWFGLLALGIYAVDGWVVRSEAGSGRKMVVAAAACLDVVAVVPAIYYWLMVRPGIRARWSLIPVGLLGLIRATYLFPGATIARASAAGLCEAGLIALVVIQARKMLHSRGEGRDPMDAIGAAVEGLLPAPFIARLLAKEIGILYYALFSWRAQPYVPPGARAFSLYSQAGREDLLFLFAFASVFEILPVHLVVSRWSVTAAWAATGLSVYGAVWLIGMARSIGLRPALVGPEEVELRYGLLFRMCIPADRIAGVREAQAGDDAVLAPRKYAPNVCVELAGPVYGERLFGSNRRMDRVALAVENRAEFEQAVCDLRGSDRAPAHDGG